MWSCESVNMISSRSSTTRCKETTSVTVRQKRKLISHFPAMFACVYKAVCTIVEVIRGFFATKGNDSAAEHKLIRFYLQRQRDNDNDDDDDNVDDDDNDDDKEDNNC